MDDSVIRHKTLGPLPILAMTREPDALPARRRTASPRTSPDEDGGGCRTAAPRPSLVPQPGGFVPLSGNRHAS